LVLTNQRKKKSEKLAGDKCKVVGATKKGRPLGPKRGPGSKKRKMQKRTPVARGKRKKFK